MPFEVLKVEYSRTNPTYTGWSWPTTKSITLSCRRCLSAVYHLKVSSPSDGFKLQKPGFWVGFGSGPSKFWVGFESGSAGCVIHSNYLPIPGNLNFRYILIPDSSLISPPPNLFMYMNINIGRAHTQYRGGKNLYKTLCKVG